MGIPSIAIETPGAKVLAAWGGSQALETHALPRRPTQAIGGGGWMSWWHKSAAAGC